MKKKILCLSDSASFHLGLQSIFEGIENIEVDFVKRNDSLWKTSIFKRFKLLKKYDILYCFWAETRLYRLWIYKAAGVKIINHYIGTDLYTIMNCPVRRFTPKMIAGLTETLCVSKLLQEELSSFSVKAKLLPFTNLQLKKFPVIYPQNRTALVFMPENRKDFFNYNYIVKLAELFKDTQFTLFPFKKTNENLPGNIKTVEWVERVKMLDFYSDYRVFIRIPKHDGLPNTLLEAMLSGRWTIWSFDFPHAKKADNFQKLRESFQELIEKPEPNQKAANYVSENYNFNKIKENYISFFTNSSA